MYPREGDMCDDFVVIDGCCTRRGGRGLPLAGPVRCPRRHGGRDVRELFRTQRRRLLWLFEAEVLLRRPCHVGRRRRRGRQRGGLRLRPGLLPLLQEVLPLLLLRLV